MVLFLSTLSTVKGQSADSIPWSPKVLYMHTWPDSNASFPYAFRMKIRVYPYKYHNIEGRHYFQKTDVVWVTNQSWLNDSVRERYLPLSQLYFDLAEWKARLLQEAINSSDTLPDMMRYRTELALSNLIDRIGEDTQNGADSVEMQKWKNWTDSALSVVPHRNYPDWSPGAFRVGIHLNSGFQSFGESLNTYMKSAFINGVGIDFYVKRWMIALQGETGMFLKNGKLSVADFSYTDSSSLSMHEFGLSTGWKVIRKERFGLTPELGWNTFRLVNNDVVKGSFFHKSRFSFGWSTGIRGEFNFRDLFQSMHAQTGLQLWGYAGYTQTNFMELEKGGSWIVRLGIGIHIKSIIPGARTPGIYYF